jgi:hypothetical protein
LHWDPISWLRRLCILLFVCSLLSEICDREYTEDLYHWYRRLEPKVVFWS